MQEVTFQTYEESDILALFNQYMESWIIWSNDITDQINVLTAQVASVIETNKKQNSRITVLKDRLDALEEKVATLTTP